ncbi:hypothetical protein Y032_0099g3197 [Ancylostoma ceylanicum]|uniref:Uncharacterized protein n=1 Tax=Ancylostoma ceylanicum TaxID=53326 RepID=A0A016TJ67_9BILA|nr:hypothetical protein Y032_0099g3197 [Ancylostoma ceylanicum]
MHIDCGSGSLLLLPLLPRLQRPKALYTSRSTAAAYAIRQHYVRCVTLFRLDLASTLASPSVHGGAANIVRQLLTPAGEEQTKEEQQKPPTDEQQEQPPDEQQKQLTEEQQKILDKLNGCSSSEEPVSAAVYGVLEKILEKEEEALAKKQAAEFTRWHKRRQELIKAQADRLLLKVRAEEIAKELAELEHHTEKLSFFENRLKWEKKAAQNAEIIQQTASQRSEEAAQ